MQVARCRANSSDEVLNFSRSDAHQPRRDRRDHIRAGTPGSVAATRAPPTSPDKPCDECLDAMAANDAQDRHLTVRTAPSGNEGVRIEISDVGHGLPADRGERVFERYFRPSRRGWGWAFSLPHHHDAHGGTLARQTTRSAVRRLFCTLPRGGRRVMGSGVSSEQ